jgi:hypothetical protein
MQRGRSSTASISEKVEAIRSWRQCLLQLLEQPLIGRIVSKPLLATPNQRLILGHTSVIDIILPTQRNGDGVPLGIRYVAFEHVIGPFGVTPSASRCPSGQTITPVNSIPPDLPPPPCVSQKST